MTDIAWGFMFLLPFSWSLYKGNPRNLCYELRLNCPKMLLIIFVLLVTTFININLGTLYINGGGICALIFGLRLLMLADGRSRWHICLIALLSGVICFLYNSGLLWWLARLPFNSYILMPLLAAIMGLIISRKNALIIGGLSLGVLSGHILATAYFNKGLLAIEFGAISHLNTLLLSIGLALLIKKVLQISVNKGQIVSIK